MSWTEVKYTVKLISKNLAFSLLCVSILTFGLAIVIPLYALFDNTSLKDLPLAEGERYVSFQKKPKTDDAAQTPNAFDAFHLRYFKDNSTSFDLLEPWLSRRLNVDDGDTSTEIRSAEITPELLAATKVVPVLGRLFTAADLAERSEPVALISYELWQSYYAGRSDVVGSHSHIHSVTTTIVGVLPPHFSFPTNQQLWIPLRLPASSNAGGSAENLSLVGILKKGVSVAKASTEMQLLEAKIVASWNMQYRNIASVEVVTYVSGMSPIATPLTSSLIFIGSILALVITNISNLFVTRSGERLTELAIRSALGATPGKIASALLLESLLICALSYAAGITLSHYLIRFVDGALANQAYSPNGMFWWDLSLNGRILLASALATVFIWLSSGGMAAWRISRTNLSELLATSGKGLSFGGNLRLNKALVNFQLVLGCVLLTPGILFSIFESDMHKTPVPGIELLHIGRLNLADQKIGDDVTGFQYLERLATTLKQRSDVQSVAYATQVPGYTSDRRPYAGEGADLQGKTDNPSAFVVSASPDYFAVFGIGIRQGRSFSVDDVAGSPAVAIVDKRLADALWPGASAIGKRIQVNPGDNAQWLTIAGVSEPSIMESSLRSGSAGVPVIYIPLAQAAPKNVMLVVKALNTNFSSLSVLSNAAMQTDHDVALTAIASLARLQQDNLGAQTFLKYMIYTLMLVALYLTTTATYGLAARAVGRRQVETGIRMALGANHGIVMKLFLQDGFKRVMVGLGLGIPLSIVGPYFFISQNPIAANVLLPALFPTALTITLLMGMIVLLANYFPAKKIINMEPVDALRYE